MRECANTPTEDTPNNHPPVNTDITPQEKVNEEEENRQSTDDPPLDQAHEDDNTLSEDTPNNNPVGDKNNIPPLDMKIERKRLNRELVTPPPPEIEQPSKRTTITFRNTDIREIPGYVARSRPDKSRSETRGLVLNPPTPTQQPRATGRGSRGANRPGSRQHTASDKVRQRERLLSWVHDSPMPRSSASGTQSESTRGQDKSQERSETPARPPGCPRGRGKGAKSGGSKMSRGGGRR